MIAATHRTRTASLFLSVAWLVLLLPARASFAQNGSVVEYYHRALDSYFISGRAAEQSLLDTLPSDFTRTGASFAASAAADALLARVCRVYISTATPFASTHFYGREDTDCAFLRSENRVGFTYEDFDFSVNVPNLNGTCPTSAPIAVYRSFRPVLNGRTPNHRYTVSRGEYDAMTASGWTAEGVNFCVAAATSAKNVHRTGFKTNVSPARTPFTDGCDGVPVSAAATVNRGAVVEPHISRNPNNEEHLLTSWQQDRWSNGGSRGLGGAVSFDGGRTWSATPAPFSRCGGGSVSNGGDYVRATDPWSAIAIDGTAYQMALSFSDAAPGIAAVSSMRVARSVDGGRNWEKPVSLVREVSDTIFHDKNMMVVDPTDARFAYAVWGRLDDDGSGPAWFSRTTDRGATWEPSRGIFDPGPRNQTFGNNLAVLSDGTLVNVFLEFVRTDSGAIATSNLRIIRSSDRGETWSAPSTIIDFRGIGTVDPETNVAVRDGFGLPSIAAGANRSLHLVWQDARFSNGVIDAVVYLRSDDGGSTWTAPRRINNRPDVRAFTPIVNVRADGVVGVAYHDFRENTASQQTLLTVTRLTTSTDGVAWYESEIDGAFNLNTAPFARGYFLGDYFGLTSRKGAFEAFFVRTTGSAPDNRNEAVFASVAEGTLKRGAKPTETDETLEPRPLSEIFRTRIHENIERMIDARRIGALARSKKAPAPAPF